MTLSLVRLRTLTALLAVLVGSVVLVAPPASAAETRVLSGIVTFADGTPAVGATATVYVYRADQGFWDNLFDENGDWVSARADATGRYEIELPRGTYRLEFNGPYDPVMKYSAGPRWWPDASSSRTASDVVLDTDRSDVDMLLRRDGRLSGVVTVESTGEVLQGAVVSIVDVDGETVEELTTPATGRWSTIVAPGDYTVRVSVGRNVAENHRDLATEWFDDAYSRESADVLTVGDHRTKKADVALGGAASIAGRLTTPRGIDGAEFTVDVLQRDGDEWSTVTSTTSTADGAFALGGLAPGIHRLCYRQDLTTPKEHRTAQWGQWASGCVGGRGVSSATDLDLAGGEQLSLGDVMVTASARVEGRVTVAAGEPVAGVRVCPFVDSFSIDACLERVGYAMTDEDGRYVAHVGRSTSVKIAYVPSRLSTLAPRYSGDVSRAASATPVAVSLGRTLVGQDAVLQDAGRTTYAGVVRSGGVPQSGVYVSVKSDERRYGDVQTDTSGAFSVALAPGIYAITLHKPGFVDKQVGVEVTSSDVTGAALTIQPLGRTSITGRILRAGVPLGGVGVGVVGRSGYRTSVLTDAQGRFSYVDLPPDSYTVSLSGAAPDGSDVTYTDPATGAVRRFAVTGRTTVAAGDLDLLGPALASVTPPRVTGDARVGRLVWADPGTWTVPDVSVAYQWLLDGVPVRGATSAYFTPVHADRGKELTVRVTASRRTWHPVSVTSAPVVVPSVALHTGAPSWVAVH